MELVVTVHDDGTFGLSVDGIPWTDDIDGQPLYSRETVDQVLSDARTLFGGHADTIQTPEPPPPPPPPVVDSAGNIIVENFDPSTESPTGPAPPAPSVEPNPVPPAVAPEAPAPAPDPAATPTLPADPSTPSS